MVPEKPYVFKDRKSKHFGQCLEILMFQNYWWLIDQRNRHYLPDAVSKNALHLHLEWLLARGEDRIVKMLCPICKFRPARFLSVIPGPYGASINADETCCKNEYCKKHLRYKHPNKVANLLPIKFSSILEVSKSNQPIFAQALRDIFGFSKRLDRQKVFDFFKAEDESTKQFDMYGYMICYKKDCWDCAHRYQSQKWCPQNNPDEEHTISEESIHCLGFKSVSL